MLKITEPKIEKIISVIKAVKDPFHAMFICSSDWIDEREKCSKTKNEKLNFRMNEIDHYMRSGAVSPSIFSPLPMITFTDVMSANRAFESALSSVITWHCP